VDRTPISSLGVLHTRVAIGGLVAAAVGARAAWVSFAAVGCGGSGGDAGAGGVVCRCSSSALIRWTSISLTGAERPTFRASDAMAPQIAEISVGSLFSTSVRIDDVFAAVVSAALCTTLTRFDPSGSRMPRARPTSETSCAIWEMRGSK